MSRRQISKIYPGIIHLNRKEEKWFERLLKRDGRCQACGTKRNLQPHHIIPCHVYDKLYLDVDNGAVLCQSCHDRYHHTCFPINAETFREFCLKKHHPKNKTKSKKRYSRKKYESSPLYSKIKINDFTKPKKRKRKRKKSKKRKPKRFNPIFLTKEWGSDDWEYRQRMELEKDVLGDIYEKERDY
ncbi:HNH endonuclease [Methanobrevibacter sp.]|uniref:HNH endonuclease n=1 Tax=Methanobrevibacter sp. TaxID=66852 RepID=UPI002E79C310|nr:HNH endonuclease signature motif containing protein [Methanobrevibacter sp.]MEE1336655.1 HNH endonuclease signature motif containing protein [Methanobrevibacter sp.]